MTGVSMERVWDLSGFIFMKILMVPGAMPTDTTPMVIGRQEPSTHQDPGEPIPGTPAWYSAGLIEN